MKSTKFHRTWSFLVMREYPNAVYLELVFFFFFFEHFPSTLAIAFVKQASPHARKHCRKYTLRNRLQLVTQNFACNFFLRWRWLPGDQDLLRQSTFLRRWRSVRIIHSGSYLRANHQEALYMNVYGEFAELCMFVRITQKFELTSGELTGFYCIGLGMLLVRLTVAAVNS